MDHIYMASLQHLTSLEFAQLCLLQLQLAVAMVATYWES